jgi:enoyl-CoA hydratase/carnithine racemase
MNRPRQRNALSEQHMRELIKAFEDVAGSDAAGVVLAGAGPVFCAGHDYGEMAELDTDQTRMLLITCTELMTTMQSIPQPVLARVHGLATAAGCQLVATADLAVAAEEAGFATPGGAGGSFCHTPMVAVGRAVSRKRALEMGMTGDVVDARMAAEWGLINRAVPADELDDACLELLDRATRGSRTSKGLGKRTFYTQIELDQRAAYARAIDVRAQVAETEDAHEHIAAFLEKRTPEWRER